MDQRWTTGNTFMISDPAPILLDVLYWITLLAVVVSSAPAVLMAGFKQGYVSNLLRHQTAHVPFQI